MSKVKRDFIKSEEEILRNGVLAHLEEQDPNYSPSMPVSITLKDNNGIIYAGASGFYFLGCMNIEWLWVSKTHRKKGNGTKILNMIDDFGKKHNISFIILFCYGEENLGFYKHHNYFVEFERKGYDNNISKYYLRKNL